MKNSDRFAPHQAPEKFRAVLPEFSSVFDLFTNRVDIYGEKLFAVNVGASTSEISYQELYKRVGRTASFMSGMGLKRDDKILVIAYNCLEFLYCYFAGLKLGIVLVPINPDLSRAEIDYVVQDSKSLAIFFEDSLGFKLKDLKCDDPDFIKVSFTELNQRIVSGKLSEVSTEPLDLFDDAVIIYTSGTTGHPKGVVLNQLNILSDSKSIKSWFELTENDRALCLLPLFHNNGQIVTLIAPLYAGASTVIIHSQTGVMAFWEVVDKYNVTYTSVMATILGVLNSLQIKRTDRSMRFIICGGQVLLKSVQSHFEKRFNIPIVEGFGLTETTSFACFNAFKDKSSNIQGSIGKPLPVNHMEIMSEEGEFLGAHEEGEIVIRGINVAREYYNKSTVNSKSFRGGWFHSGDYGFKDEENNFFFRGRKDFLIIRGGENIYPADIENAIYKHPDVVEVAVIGIKDKILGQEICAFVQTVSGSPLDQAGLIDFCRDKLAKFRLPKKVYILSDLEGLDEIPKGPTKKTLYYELENYYDSKLDR